MKTIWQRPSEQVYVYCVGYRSVAAESPGESGDVDEGVAEWSTGVAE